MSRPTVSRGFVTAAALALSGMTTLGCGGGGGSDADGLGRLSVALTLPGDIAIAFVDWKVLSATNMVLVQGTIDTSEPNLPPSVITGLPAGTGDVVSMSAVTATGVACSGTSAPFNVSVGQSVSVPVDLICGASTPGTGLGSAVIVGTLVPGDSCPVVKAYKLTPGMAPSPSGQISVSVTGGDDDVGETLSYRWTATAGVFADAAAPSTEYTCTTAGLQTLTVAITDSHAPTPCTTTVTFPAVSCL